MPKEKANASDPNSKRIEEIENSAETDMKIGQDIPYADNIPPTLISNDSKNTIAEQGHEGSDNSPDTGRVRNNQ